jgi:hypothetical protein
MKLVIVIYYNSWMQLFQKTNKHIPRVITGALTWSEDSDTHSMRV